MLTKEDIATAKEIAKVLRESEVDELTVAGQLITVLLAEREQQRTAAQEGWKLVPVEPTADMRNAGNAALDALKTETGMRLACKPYYAYRAMLAAAPQGSDK